MPHFLVSYDLRKVRNYEPLWRQLRQWGMRRILESLWVGELNSTAGNIRDVLRTMVDADDGIVVVELKPPFQWAAIRAQPDGTTFLKNISP